MPDGKVRLLFSGGKWRFDNEPALGTDRHDQGVLGHLCFHQAEHLGTKVVRAI